MSTDAGTPISTKRSFEVDLGGGAGEGSVSSGAR